MTNILIINLHSSRNAGDAALALTASQQLHQAFPNSVVTLSMNDPESHPVGEPKVGSFMVWFHPLSGKGQATWRPLEILRLGVVSLAAAIAYRWSKKPIYPFLSREQKAFLQAYFDADLVASAPGNFLYSSGKLGLSFLVAIYSMAYALWAGKPLYILPQSIGPIKRSWERWLIRGILNRARLVLVREEASMDQIHQVKMTNPRTFLQPDMAFSFSASSQAEASAWLKTNGIDSVNDRPLLGITAINWGAQTGFHALQQQYELALLAAVKVFIEITGGKVIFFPQVIGVTASADDRLPARRVIASIQQPTTQVQLIDNPPSPAMLKAAYGLMDLFIGTRMHSNIFALSGNVPVLAIAYRHKTQGIMHMLGLDDWTVDIQNAKESLLADKIAALWQQRTSVRLIIQNTLPRIIEQSSHTGALVFDDYAQYKNNRS